MEDNKKFELNDDALDEVAGGVNSEEGYSVTYNGMTFSVGQAVCVPYCSLPGCTASRNMGHIPAVITGFRNVTEANLKSGEATVYLRMDCCKNEAKQLIKRLMPYRPTTRN